MTPLTDQRCQRENCGLPPTDEIHDYCEEPRVMCYGCECHPFLPSQAPQAPTCPQMRNGRCDGSCVTCADRDVPDSEPSEEPTRAEPTHVASCGFMGRHCKGDCLAASPQEPPTSGEPPRMSDVVRSASMSEIIRVASNEVARICAGRGGKTFTGLRGRGWTMSVPVRPDDSDEIFTELITFAATQASQLAALRAAATAMTKSYANWAMGQNENKKDDLLDEVDQSWSALQRTLSETCP